MFISGSSSLDSSELDSSGDDSSGDDSSGEGEDVDASGDIQELESVETQ